jgi:outer membrane receptor protein involved in Fe transport
MKAPPSDALGRPNSDRSGGGNQPQTLRFKPSAIDSGLCGAGSKINRAGENGQSNTGAAATWRANLSETLSTEKFAVTLQAIYIGEGLLDVTNNTLASNRINDNTIPDVTYFNLYGSYNLTPRVRAFAAVNNLLNKDPLTSPYAVLAAPVNGIY